MHPFLTEHTGDFAGGYIANWFLNASMDLSPRLRKIPERRRVAVSAAISLAVVTAVEVFPIFGSPNLEDIPAGVAGIIASFGVRKLAQRWVGEQVR